MKDKQSPKAKKRKPKPSQHPRLLKVKDKPPAKQGKSLSEFMRDSWK